MSSTRSGPKRHCSCDSCAMCRSASRMRKPLEQEERIDVLDF